MIASLPMYDRAETRSANDLLWAHIARNLPISGVPDHLTRAGTPMAHWTAPDLLLSQTCSLPYRAQLHDTAQLIGVFDHGLDCAPGYYYSAIVVRADDPRESLSDFAAAKLAYNDPMSQSGWAAPQNMARRHGWSFANTTPTGAHLNSARMVAHGAADLAAIDVISWTMMTRWDAFATGLRVLTQTPPTPALPLITASASHVAMLRSAIRDALSTLSAQTLTTLCIDGLTWVPSENYRRVPTPPWPRADLI